MMASSFTLKCNICGTETEFYQDILTLNVPALGKNNANISIIHTKNYGMNICCKVCGNEVGDE